jgi:hypothetical protein
LQARRDLTPGCREELLEVTPRTLHEQITTQGEVLVAKKITGGSLSLSAGVVGLTMNFEREGTDDADSARRVLRFLENRRILWADHLEEEEAHCVASANDIRNELTRELQQSTLSTGMTQSLKAIRAASREFVDEAGPDGRNFRHAHGCEANPFALALGRLKALVGVQLALLVREFDLDVEPQLVSVLPPAPNEQDAGGVQELQRWLTP